jgi:hypothetical protein
LARRFVQKPEITCYWLTEAIVEFQKNYDREALPWMLQASFDRGTFATLLGIRFNENFDWVQLVAIGDTIAVLCDANQTVDTFPYRTSQEFNRSPLLISTQERHPHYLTNDAISEAFVKVWQMESLLSPAIFCMTDALGKWFLEQMESGQEPSRVLRALSKKQAFRSFVLQQRQSGAMRRDDTTLLAFW